MSDIHNFTNTDTLNGAINTNVYRIRMEEKNDCTVRALAAVLGVDYQIAHTALSKSGRVNGKGCHFPKQKAAIEYLGFHLKPKEIPTGLTSNEITRFLKSGKYLVYIQRHVYAVIDGQFVNTFEEKRTKVETVYEVVRFSDGQNYTVEELEKVQIDKRWRDYAGKHGLSEHKHRGKLFRTKGKTFRVVDIKQRKQNNPVICVNVEDHSDRWRFGKDFVKEQIRIYNS